MTCFISNINSISKTVFYHLENIARIKGFVAQKDQEKLIHAFISSRLDNCNGLPKKTIKQLQLIQDAAARIVSRTKRTDSHPNSKIFTLASS